MKIIYSPFGDIISDSNPSLFVPSSSFKGGIPLPDTGLIILRDGDNSRPWDARAGTAEDTVVDDYRLIVGRFLSFPPSSLLPSTRDLLNDPSIALNPMAMKDSDLPWAAADIPDGEYGRFGQITVSLPLETSQLGFVWLTPRRLFSIDWIL